MNIYHLIDAATEYLADHGIHGATAIEELLLSKYDLCEEEIEYLHEALGIEGTPVVIGSASA